MNIKVCNTKKCDIKHKSLILVNVTIWSIIGYFIIGFFLSFIDNVSIQSESDKNFFQSNLQNYTQLVKYIKEEYPDNICITKYVNHRCRDEHYKYLKDKYLQKSLDDLKIDSIWGVKLGNFAIIGDSSLELNLNYSVGNYSNKIIYTIDQKNQQNNLTKYCPIIDINKNQSWYAACDKLAHLMSSNLVKFISFMFGLFCVFIIKISLFNTIKMVGFSFTFIFLGIMYYKISFQMMQKFIFPSNQINNYTSIGFAMLCSFLMSFVFVIISLFTFKKRFKNK